MKTNNNNVNKTLIKHLANAPVYALERALRDLSAEERATAIRIFNAVTNTAKNTKTDKTEGGANNER
jgi:hypothetical protein